MRISYTIPYSNGRLYLPTRVREWLQVPRDTRLHGRVIDDIRQPSIIISPIPSEYWSSCYRITICTSEEPDALNGALCAIRDASLSILHMIASANAPRGETTITAIVTPVNRTMRRRRQPRVATPTVSGLSNTLIRLLKRTNCLSKSRLYGKSSPIRNVRVTPMLVLRALAELPRDPHGMLSARIPSKWNDCFAIDIKGSLVNLSEAKLLPASGNDALNGSTVLQCIRTDDTEASLSAMITVDTEEYHYRIALLPTSKYAEIRIPVTATGPHPGCFLGLTQTMAEALTSQPNAASIYYTASSIVDHKAPGIDPGPVSIERNIQEHVDLRFLCDVSHVRDGAAALVELIKSRIADSSYHREGRTVSITAGKQPVVRPLVAPLVFTATNVKEGMPRQYIDMAFELFAELKDMHLRPVFLANLGGKPMATPQMIDLLNVSSILVSLYFPERRNTLKFVGRNAPKCAPSAWTTFEEAYMVGKKDRPVFRLIHNDVFSPPYIDETSRLSFSDQVSFTQQLEILRDRITKAQAESTWRTVLAECGTMLEGMDLRRLEQADPEDWLLEKLNKRAT